MRKVLIVDDDPTICDVVKLALQSVELDSYAVETAHAAFEAFDNDRPALVILDLGLPDINGLEVLEWIRSRDSAIPVVVLTAEDAIETAVECMRLGATDFVQKPFDSARLATTVKNAYRQGVMESQLDAVLSERRRESGLATLRGNSTSLQQVVGLLKKAISTEVTILIQGESGTGKEVLARAVHAESDRCSAPFIPVNCGAIPDSLIESEFFGHERGAFTGAQSARAGLFEQANGGTVFLDEIGELRLDLQVRLLRVLQEREVVRLGGNTPRSLDIRVIAATNRDLNLEVQDGRFREDLYYRLSVFPVNLPPLRERGEDTLLLAEHFLSLNRNKATSRALGFSFDAEQALLNYPWPGNVRQLQNVVERAVILAEGHEIQLTDLSDEIVCYAYGDVRDVTASDAAPQSDASEITNTVASIIALADVEKQAILSALQSTSWNIKLASERLGIGRATLYRRINEYGLERDSGSVAANADQSPA